MDIPSMDKDKGKKKSFTQVRCDLATAQVTNTSAVTAFVIDLHKALPVFVRAAYKYLGEEEPVSEQGKEPEQETNEEQEQM